MRIKNVEEDCLTFDDGSKIMGSHDANCCEYNYAAFSEIDPLAFTVDFDKFLLFEVVEDYGFRFGNKNQMFFVPCYSIQNGYYSSEVEISYLIRFKTECLLIG